MVCCVFTYVYMLNVTIKHSIAIDDAATQIANLRVTVSSLEESYFTAQNRLTLSKAQSLGFQTMKNVTYLSKNTSGSLSLYVKEE